MTKTGIRLLCFCVLIAVCFGAGSALTPTVQAREIMTMIHDWIPPDPGDSASGEWLLLAESNGRVYRVSADDPDLVAMLSLAKTGDQRVALDVSNRRVMSARILPPEFTRPLESEPDPESSPTLNALMQPESFEVTVLNDDREARDLFDSLEGAGRFKYRSQCFQRAHLWSWLMWNERAVRSMKVFLFFTRRYIREFEYDWWFHVSPYVHVPEGARVLDYRFTNKPLPMKKWTEHFMKNDADCPVAARYTDYSEHQEEQYCYLRQVPMYYYQPQDVERLDRTGESIAQFRASDIEHAKKGRKRQ